MAGGRHKFWITLARTLSTLPGRNLLVLGGDFNCTPEPSFGHVGHGQRAPAHYRADAREFNDIIREYDLCALNTWCSPKQ